MRIILTELLPTMSADDSLFSMTDGMHQFDTVTSTLQIHCDDDVDDGDDCCFYAAARH